MVSSRPLRGSRSEIDLATGVVRISPSSSGDEFVYSLAHELGHAALWLVGGTFADELYEEACVERLALVVCGHLRVDITNRTLDRMNGIVTQLRTSVAQLQAVIGTYGPVERRAGELLLSQLRQARS